MTVERVSKILDALGGSLERQSEQPIVRGHDDRHRRAE